jgi:phage gpG-like protein
MSGNATVEIRISGEKRVIFIFENLVSALTRAFPPSLEEFAKRILENARGRAALFARTGELMASLAMQMEGEDTAIIGPTAPYAPFVTWPTGAHWIGANLQVIPFSWRFVGMHPGTSGNTYLQDAAQEEFENLPGILSENIGVELQDLDETSKGMDGSE